MLRFIDFTLTSPPEVKKINFLRGRGRGLDGRPRTPPPPEVRLDALGVLFKQLY